MADRLLQDVAQIIHSYYQNRGNGLEKIAQKVIDVVSTYSHTTDLSKSTNLKEVTLSNVDRTYHASTDKLLVQDGGVLYIYESQSKGDPLKSTLWKLFDDAFFNDYVTVEELLNQGALVYLMK
jgi:hypothetical protein